MVRKKGKQTLIIAIVAGAVLLVAIGTVALMQALKSDESDPYAQTSSSDSGTVKTEEEAVQNSDNNTSDEPAPSTDTEETSNQPALDPATVGTLDIPSAGITVSYVKGAGGFEYEVSRTQNGTRYVELRSAELIGTKCTNDVGAFASILLSPSSNEATTLSKTTVVEGTTYGLSLEATTCTSNEEKLKSFQQSFSDAFGLLKKLD